MADKKRNTHPAPAQVSPRKQESQNRIAKLERELLRLVRRRLLAEGR